MMCVQEWVRCMGGWLWVMCVQEWVRCMGGWLWVMCVLEWVRCMGGWLWMMCVLEWVRFRDRPSLDTCDLSIWGCLRVDSSQFQAGYPS